MEPWDADSLSTSEHAGLGEILDAMDQFLRTAPPGGSHTEVSRARDHLQQGMEETGGGVGISKR